VSLACLAGSPFCSESVDLTANAVSKEGLNTLELYGAVVDFGLRARNTLANVLDTSRESDYRTVEM